MMLDINIYWKLGILAVILVGLYIYLRSIDQDPIVALWESFSEIEWDWTVLILTIVFSSLFWVMLWKAPWWATDNSKGFWYILSFPMKMLMTVLLPLISYPMALRAWTK